MASIAMMGLGAIVNAFAFTGSSYLFRKLDRSDDRIEEYKRHNLELEEMQREKLDDQEKREKIIDELRDQGIAIRDFKDFDAVMKKYYQVSGRKDLMFLSNDVKDSDNNKMIGLIFGLGGLYTAILILYRYYKNVPKITVFILQCC